MERGRIIVVQGVAAALVQEAVPQEAWEVRGNGCDREEVDCHCQHMLLESGVKVGWHRDCGKHSI